METGLKLFLGLIFLVVGVIEMNGLLWIVGLALLVVIGLSVYQDYQHKRKEQAYQIALTDTLNAFLDRYQVLKVNDHICIGRMEKLNSYLDAIVYYEKEATGTLKDYAVMPNFKQAYTRLFEAIKKLDTREFDMVDEDRNGVDDRKQNGDYYILELERAMQLFDNVTITSGLKDAVMLLKKITELEKKYPQIKPRLRKLYQHYLPLLLNILNQYQVLKDKQASLQEISNMENKLEKTIVLVDEALKTLIESFVADDVLNMSTDISVLEAVLKRDGLVQEGTLGGSKS